MVTKVAKTTIIVCVSSRSPYLFVILYKSYCNTGRVVIIFHFILPAEWPSGRSANGWCHRVATWIQSCQAYLVLIYSAETETTSLHTLFIIRWKIFQVDLTTIVLIHLNKLRSLWLYLLSIFMERNLLCNFQGKLNIFLVINWSWRYSPYFMDVVYCWAGLDWDVGLGSSASLLDPCEIFNIWDLLRLVDILLNNIIFQL